MRTILLSLLVGIIGVTACSTPDDKAKKLIREYLKEQDHKWVQTDSLWIGSLDTVYSIIENNREYRQLITKADSLSKIGMSRSIPQGETERAMDEAADLYRNAQGLRTDYIPKLDGWEVASSFLSTYKDGRTEINLCRFRCDKKITKIQQIEDFTKQSRIRDERFENLIKELELDSY